MWNLTCIYSSELHKFKMHYIIKYHNVVAPSKSYHIPFPKSYHIPFPRLLPGCHTLCLLSPFTSQTYMYIKIGFAPPIISCHSTILFSPFSNGTWLLSYRDNVARRYSHVYWLPMFECPLSFYCLIAQT